MHVAITKGLLMTLETPRSLALVAVAGTVCFVVSIVGATIFASDLEFTKSQNIEYSILAFVLAYHRVRFLSWVIVLGTILFGSMLLVKPNTSTILLWLYVACAVNAATSWGVFSLLMFYINNQVFVLDNLG